MRPAVGAACLLFLIGSAGVAHAQATPVVAVFEIEDGTQRGKGVVAALTDYFRVKLAETQRFKVVDKSEQEAQLKKLIKQEKKNSYKTCVDSSCQIPLGKELAADRILRGKINRFGKAYVLSAEMIDLASGASMGAASDKSDGSEEGLMASVERVTIQLIGNVPPPVVAPPPPPPPPPPPAATVDLTPPPSANTAPKVESSGSGLAWTLIIGGWSVFAAGWIGEVVYTAIDIPDYILVSAIPFLGVLYTVNGSTTPLPHLGLGALQVLGAGIAVIGHVLYISADTPAPAAKTASLPAQSEGVQVFFGPGTIGIRGRF